MRGRQALFALGVSVLLALVGLAVYLLPLEPSIVRSQFTFSAAAFDSVFTTWTPVAQARFKSHFYADYALILLYVSWGYLHGKYAPSAAVLSPSLRAATTWLLPLAGVADTIENLLHSQFVASTAKHLPEWSYMAAGLAATTKWSCAVTFVGLASVAHRLRKNAA